MGQKGVISHLLRATARLLIPVAGKKVQMTHFFPAHLMSKNRDVCLLSEQQQGGVSAAA